MLRHSRSAMPVDTSGLLHAFTPRLPRILARSSSIMACVMPSTSSAFLYDICSVVHPRRDSTLAPWNSGKRRHTSSLSKSRAFCYRPERLWKQRLPGKAMVAHNVMDNTCAVLGAHIVITVVGKHLKVSVPYEYDSNTGSMRDILCCCC